MQVSSSFLYFIENIIHLLEMVCTYARDYDMCHILLGLISLVVLNETCLKNCFILFGYYNTIYYVKVIDE